MPYEVQQVNLRNLVLSANKQNTYGTALGDAALTQRQRFDGAAFARITKEFFSDIERAGKGHPWPTIRRETVRETGLGLTLDVTDFLAGWLFAFLMHKVVTTGAGPYTHTFTFEQTTKIAPVTTVYFEDTADLKFKVQDLCGVSLQLSGTDRGPLQAAIEFIGSGKHLDGAMSSLPALATPILLLGSDTDILLGAPGASGSIKERVRSWQVSLVSGVTQHRAPGGGLYASFAKIGLQRATVQLGIAAKSVDDIRTLFISDTLQELKINTNSGTAAQLNLAFPNLYFKIPQLAADGVEEVWNLAADEQDVMKGASLELFQAVAINSQPTYLVGAA
jgi:hypothetical protein